MKKQNRNLLLTSCFICLNIVNIKSQTTVLGNANGANNPAWFLGWNAPVTVPVKIEHQGTADINFLTGGINRMTINGAGSANPGFVGIGPGTANNRLDVFAGDIDVNGGRRSYMISDQSVLWHKGGNTNIFVGVGAGNSHAFGQNSENTYVGRDAGFSGSGVAINNGQNTLIGAGSGYNSNALGATYIGYNAGFTHNGIGATGNTFVGWKSGFSTQLVANDNTFVGSRAGQNNTTGDQNSFFGISSGANSTTGFSNCFFGAIAGINNGTFNRNNCFGVSAGNSGNGSDNIFVGTNSGAGGVGDKNVIVGNNAYQTGTASLENVSLGYNSMVTATANSFVVVSGSQSAPILGHTKLNTFVGYKTAFNQLSGDQNSYFGDNAGFSIGNAQNNTFVGSHAGFLKPVGDSCVFVGTSAGRSASLGGGHVFVGAGAGFNFIDPVNYYTTFVGHQAGFTMQNGGESVFVGGYAGYYSNNALDNTFVGFLCGKNNTNGSDNAFFGFRAGLANTTGIFNTCLGSSANVGSANLQNATSIGYNSVVMANSNMILGNPTTSVGIGMSGIAGGVKNWLEVNDNIQGLAGGATVPNTNIPGTNGASGLRFTQMTSATTPVPNPNLAGGVLGLTANGDVIYVQGSAGSAFGNLCSAATPVPLTGDYEMPLGTFNYFFTGNTLGGDKVSVGVPCATPLRGRFNSFEIFPTVIPTSSPAKTISGYFLNSDRSGNNLDTLMGVYGQANGRQPFGIDNTNVGGNFYAFDARTNIGIQAQASNNPTAAAPAVHCYGGRFRASAGTTDNFGIWASASGGGPGATNYAGFFQGDVFVNGGANSLTGYLVASDQMFKTNIDSIANAKSIINQLKPRTFYMDTMNTSGIKFSSKKQYGFIAQDVLTVLPALVSNITKPIEYDSIGNVKYNAITYKTLNYDGFIALLMKGMQEQQKTIDSLKTKTSKQDSINNAVQAQIAALTSSVSSCCSSTAVRTTKPEELNQLNIDLSDKDAIVLNQNVPNPFAEQTTITYNIPEKYNAVQILFYNNLGQIIKVVDVKTKGKGQLNVYANDLSRGMYSYSLFADGQMIDTKKMIKEN